MPQNYFFRSQIGDELFKEYTSLAENIKREITDEHNTVKQKPILHPTYESCYQNFINQMKVIDANSGLNQMQLWNSFWDSYIEELRKTKTASKLNELQKQFIERSKQSVSKERIFPPLPLSKPPEPPPTVQTNLNVHLSSFNEPKVEKTAQDKEKIPPLPFPVLKPLKPAATTQTNLNAQSSSFNETKIEKTAKVKEKIPPPLFMVLKPPELPATTLANLNVQTSSLTETEVQKTASDVQKQFDFSVKGTLDLMEKLCPTLGPLGSASLSIVKNCRDLGITTPEALANFTNDENVTLIKLVLNKFRVLETKSTGETKNIYNTALDWIKRLLQYAEDNSKPNTSINVESIAKSTKGKDLAYILKMIKTACALGGDNNPSKEKINKLYMEVCNFQFKMTL